MLVPESFKAEDSKYEAAIDVAYSWASSLATFLCDCKSVLLPTTQSTSGSSTFLCNSKKNIYSRIKKYGIS